MAVTKLSPKDVLMKPAVHTLRGVKLPHFKNTMNCETVKMPPPEVVIVPMQQHIGAPCVPVVKKGDTVTVGQVIADSEQFVSAPIHSGVSGTVEGTERVQLPNGSFVDAIKIKSDGLMTECPDLKPFPVNSKDDLIAAARKCGLVGLGGAGFPVHVKLSPPKDTFIDTLIINAAECEPFITTDYRECMENPQMIMRGIYRMLDFMGVDRVIIAVEDNKPEAIKTFVRIACDDMDIENRVRVMKLPSRYPQGAEKVLVRTVTGRKIPAGKLPAHVGCAVMNVTSLSVLERFIETGMPLVAKRVTVDGPAIKEPKNILVPLGTPVEKVIEFAGGFSAENVKVLMGGPMMGLALTDLSIPVLKQNNAIIAFDCQAGKKKFRSKNKKFNVPVVSKKKADKEPKIKNKKVRIPAFDGQTANEGAEERPCIHCGRCVMVCPMKLVPIAIERFSRNGNIEKLDQMGVTVCMECGCCAYSCPAQRPLVQYMRMAKENYKRGMTDGK